MIYKENLGMGKNAAGESYWICRHCNQPADHGKGGPDKNQMVLVLMCPAGRVTLGEWATEAEKKAELTACAAELARD